ncbi:Maf family nucleotide pyrophosphatase [Deefgea sp. CFH1-16]|uniref:Maf family nucleotide pyrophosphatase n=1 Tax=Deefgea sp. CFH1-16 TaxID=2675457 RepID=UPI0015F77185|nr:Maf family nucleotide pyrophosphatase [Deefgea sp. CFH1-16]MBM5573811.1 septum formation inhibitor Maf [Deefgea sp. CFH1-16]
MRTTSTSCESRQLVLASTSLYRKELLERLGLPFVTAAPNLDESPLIGETAAQTSERLAIAKAKVLADQYPNSLIIGSDQVALLNGVQLGKPGNHERAVVQLAAMRGQSIAFHTALCLYNTATQQVQSHVDITKVTMRDYSDAQIETYLRREQPYNCAGSAKTEGLGIVMIAAINSTDPAAIIGLPLIELVSMLNRESYPIL